MQKNEKEIYDNSHKKRRIRKAISRGYIYLMLLFFYSPIFVLITLSFNVSKSRSIWKGFTLDWYVKLFSDKIIIDSAFVTLKVALLAAIISTILGTFAAIGIMGFKTKTRRVLMNITYIPVLSPEIITGVSLMLLFVWSQFMNLGFTTLLLAHISFDTPFVILSVLPKLRQLDPHLFEVALDLGAKPIQALRKIILPQIWPGIITGMMMAFTLSLDDFIVSYFTSGNTSQMLSVTIYSMLKKRVSPEINALSTLIFVVVLTLLFVVNIRQNRDKKPLKRKEFYNEKESEPQAIIESEM